MKTSALIVLCFYISNTYAFTKYSSSFTGSAQNVASREELTTKLSCPPSRSSSFGRRGSMLSMPPFLKKLGFKKPDGDDKKEETTTKEQYYMAQVKDEPKATTIDEEYEIPEEMSDTQKLMKQVKESGTAGVVSYALWELGFWTLSVPVCIFAYRELTGHWPDLSDKEDLGKLGTEAFAFVNFARFAVPLRIGLALGTTPWIQKNVIDKFMKKDKSPDCEVEEGTN